jgi:hypothetical protein
MPFTEQTKIGVKRKAHFSCCLCNSLYVEVHHIIPESEGGSDKEENAAPLCPSCHETYGANPDKRKFIRERRDFWYEICSTRFTGDSNRLEKISDLLEKTVSKEDLDKSINEIKHLLEDIKNSPTKNNETKKRDVSQITGMLGVTPLGGVSIGRQCKNCGTTIGLYIGDQGKCPQCGTPW